MFLRKTGRPLALAACGLLPVTGCGDDGPHRQGDLNVLDESAPQGSCDAVERHYSGETATHREECSDIEYSTSPPVFGDHYPLWAAYGTYGYPVPLGYLVHDLEHGAVVFFYDCPEGCTDEVQAAQDAIDALPDDPRCSQAVRVQVVLVPRPGLGARWAASAWGYSLTASCFDPQIFSQFYVDHHGQGREDVCGDGQLIAAGACQ